MALCCSRHLRVSSVGAQEPYVLDKLRDTEQTYHELSVSRHNLCIVCSGAANLLCGPVHTCKELFWL